MLPKRLAPFRGRISWRTTEKKKVEDWFIEIQTPRRFAILSKKLYKPWRIVIYYANDSIVGRVVAEVDTESDALLKRSELEEKMKKMRDTVNENDLKHGDVICVKSTLTPFFGSYQHFGVFAIEGSERVVYEFRSESKETLIEFVTGSKKRIVKTKFDDFKRRYKDSFELKRCHYLNESHPEEVVKRAEEKLGHSEYNLLFNNCETFATWAKTGTGISVQVCEMIEKVLNSIGKGLVPDLVPDLVQVLVQVEQFSKKIEMDEKVISIVKALVPDLVQVLVPDLVPDLVQVLVQVLVPDLVQFGSVQRFPKKIPIQMLKYLIPTQHYVKCLQILVIALVLALCLTYNKISASEDTDSDFQKFRISQKSFLDVISSWLNPSISISYLQN